MATVLKFTKFVFIFIVFVLVAWVVVSNYSILFARTVVGQIMAIEKVEIPASPETHSATDNMKAQFSFVVRIQDSKTAEMYTSPSEDGQWSVVEKGQCAQVKFLPYPPWDLIRKGTYFGARLIKLYECPSQ